MKRIKKVVVVLLIIMILGVGVVFADNYKLESDWNSKEYKEVNPEFAFGFKGYEYKDGALFFQTDEVGMGGVYKTDAFYYSTDGNITEKSLGLSYGWVTDYWMFEDDIYYVTTSGENGLSLVKVDKELDIQSSNNKEIGIDLVQFEQLQNNGGFDTTSVNTIAKDTDGGLVFYTEYDSKTLIKIDKDFSKISTIEYTEANVQKYFPEIAKIKLMNKNSENDKIVYSSYLELNDGSLVYVGSKTNGNAKEAYLNVVKNDATVWFKHESKYESFSNPILVQNFIVVKASYDKEKTFGTQRSDILMYDLSGNLVYTLSFPNTHFNNIISFGDYFVVDKLYIEGSCVVEDWGTFDLWNSSSCDTFYIYEKYIPEKLTTVIEDNPDTAALPIILFLAVSLSAVFIMKKNSNKLSDLN